MSPDASSWSDRYQADKTPWDHGAAHPELERLIESGALAPRGERARALVPGCGRGHDALALARAGWEVTAIDFAPEARDVAGPALAEFGGQVLLEDALTHRPKKAYDLLFEHTFFCALAPEQREAYGLQAARVLRPGASLVALIFPVGKPVESGGPPWGIGLGDLERALASDFLLRLHDQVERGIPERSWGEELAVFERASY